ncbi:polynucleotide adenylyltransferase [Alphaproteobacteria bacterium]|nr:polynucleotide adenylyltransferase [Alphaproteobacteria bacterium]
MPDEAVFFPVEAPLGQLPLTLRWLNDPRTRRIMELLGGDCQARFVGGAVRDGLLGRETDDIDIATVLYPPAVASALNPEFRVLPIGARFGSVAVFLDGGLAVQITTLRRDIRTDGRRAVVEFSDSWLEDSRRRDFTMNALYADLAGRVYDYQDGIKDLGRGLVRFIGDAQARIAEDRLRALRFWRFFARYGQGKPDREACLSCRAAASSGALARLSNERIAQEMGKIFGSPRADSVLRLMAEYEVLPAVMAATPEGLDILQQLVFLEEGGVVHPMASPDSLRRLAAVGEAPPWVAKRADRKRLAAARRLAFGQGPLSMRDIAFAEGALVATDALLLRWAAQRARSGGKVGGDNYLAALDFLRDNPPEDSPARASDYPGLTGPALGAALSETTRRWLSARPDMKV